MERIEGQGSKQRKEIHGESERCSASIVGKVRRWYPVEMLITGWEDVRQWTTWWVGRIRQQIRKGSHLTLSLLSYCSSIQYILSIKCGANLVPDPRDIHNLGTAFRVLSILAFGSIFWLKKSEKSNHVRRGKGVHPEKASHGLAWNATCHLASDVRSTLQK